MVMSVEAIGKSDRVSARELAKQERQDMILIAARTLFAERSYDAMTLREVAEQAG